MILFLLMAPTVSSASPWSAATTAASQVFRQCLLASGDRLSELPKDRATKRRIYASSCKREEQAAIAARANDHVKLWDMSAKNARASAAAWAKEQRATWPIRTFEKAILD